MDIRYWAGAGRSFLRHARSPGFLAQVARSGLVADTTPKAPTIYLLDAYPAAEGLDIDLGSVNVQRSTLDPLEQLCLVAIAKLRKPAKIFEFGTYSGATTLLLARNVPDATILTLDLGAGGAFVATVPEEAENASRGVGARFAGRPEAARIEQLLGDSRTFDFSPWLGTIDLVIVDAGHEYEFALADTLTSFRLLRPGGVIIWDDYTPGWPGVVRAADASGREVFRLDE